MWCSKEAGIIIGKKLITKDSEQLPRRAVFSPEPCTDCEGKMKQGITCVEVSPHADGYELQFQCKMTGRWTVVKEEWVRNLYSDWYGPENVEENMAKVHKNTPPKILFDVPTFEHIFGEALKKYEQE
jgi:hypothetical protein